MPRRRVRRPSPEARRLQAELVRQLQAEPYQVLARQLVEARTAEEREAARRALREWCNVRARR